MIDYYNIEIYAKILIGLIGAIVSIGKIRETFSSVKRKQELKLDLEIIEKLYQIDKFDIERIEKITELKLKKYFDNSSEGITDFFIGMVMLVGFGYWSIDLFNGSENFNGWIILTLFCSLIGLTMIMGNKPVQQEKDVFYKVGFYDKSNFIYGLLITLFTGILTPILILKLDGFSFWQFLSGLFLIIGIVSLTRNIKRIN